MSKMCLKTILLAEGPPEHAVHHTWKKTSRCAQRKSSWQCWDQGTKSKEGCATMWNHDPRKALGYKMKYQFDSELLDRILKGWFRIKLFIWFRILIWFFRNSSRLNNKHKLLSKFRRSCRCHVGWWRSYQEITERWTSLFCKQTPLAHFIRLDQINLNDYFAIIYVCFHSSYSNAVVFVALFSSTYYNMAPTHLEKPRNASCPHVPWTTPRKHPYTPATSVQEPDDSLPIEIGWRSSSQLMVPSLSPLGQVEAAQMSHVRVWLLPVVQWHMSCLGFGFLCPSCWKKLSSTTIISLYNITDVLCTIKTIYSMYMTWVITCISKTSTSRLFLPRPKNNFKHLQRIATATPRNLYLWIWALHSWKKDGNQLLV